MGEVVASATKSRLPVQPKTGQGETHIKSNYSPIPLVEPSSFFPW